MLPIAKSNGPVIRSLFNWRDVSRLGCVRRIEFGPVECQIVGRTLDAVIGPAI